MGTKYICIQRGETVVSLEGVAVVAKTENEDAPIGEQIGIRIEYKSGPSVDFFYDTAKASRDVDFDKIRAYLATI